MTKKTECKIVQDLLPSYIDNLTDTETNSFIEKHIENCSECEEVLKNMQGDIKLEKINNSKKINALKKVKRRYIRIVIISILTIILIGIIGLYCWNNYRFVTDESGKISIERFTFNKRNISKNTNTIIKYKHLQAEGTIDGYAYTTYILTVNEKGIIINTRVKEEGYQEEELERLYERYKFDEKVAEILSNVQKIDNSIIYNDNTMNGRDINKVVNNFKNVDEIITYSEIYEY